MSALKMFGNQAKNGMVVLGEVKPPHPLLSMGLVRREISGPSALEAALAVWLQFWADGLCVSEVVDPPITGCSTEFCLHSDPTVNTR